MYALFGWMQRDVGQKDRLLLQLKHKLEESQKLQVGWIKMFCQLTFFIICAAKLMLCISTVYPPYIFVE